jgi:hypothetical protein
VNALVDSRRAIGRMERESLPALRRHSRWPPLIPPMLAIVRDDSLAKIVETFVQTSLLRRPLTSPTTIELWPSLRSASDRACRYDRVESEQ